jgi:hypothetical protein
MGFNVGDFISDAASSVANRAISGVVDKVDSALGGGGYTGLGVSILSSGASVQTIESIASLKFDQLLDNIADDFFGRLKGSITGSDQGRLPTSIPGSTSIDLGGAGTLKFPHDLGQYAFALQFAKYKRPVPLSRSTDEITQTIYLPLPRELNGGHQMNLATPETGLIGSVVDASMLAIEKGGVDGGTAASVALPAASLAVGAAASATGVIGIVGKMAAAGALSDSVSAVVEQTVGAVPNPNISVSYKGPALRTFQFNWEFSPNNANESQILQNILTEIQKRSLAAFSVEGSSALLSYPETVKVKVLPGGPGEIGDLMKFKKAFVSGIDIRYAPNGLPSFFKGTKAPTFIGLTITLQEIEYFVSADYGGTNAGGFSEDANNAVEWIKNQVTSVGTASGLGDLFGGTNNAPENPPEEGP